MFLLSIVTVIASFTTNTNDTFYHWMVLILLYLFIFCESGLAILLNMMCLDSPRVALGVTFGMIEPPNSLTKSTGKSLKGSRSAMSNTASKRTV